MSAARPVRDGSEPSPRGRFVLYVEGPRDRDILSAWASRLSPALAEALVPASVILGGRQPGRAAGHFREVRAGSPAARAVCVLDRDDAPPTLAESPDEGFELFTWSRRHIESYLLVPGAIHRMLVRGGADPRAVRAIGRMLPAADDEAALRDVDAKRLLSAQGELSRAFGRPLAPGRLARELFVGELHPDIRTLFDRMRQALRAAGAAA